MPDHNLMPIREFVERGYLQETNRRFLHPLGLALTVSSADRPYATLLLTAEGLDALEEMVAKTGPLDSANAEDLEELRSRLAEARAGGMADHWITGVWDCRDDPEGILFGEIDGQKVTQISNQMILRRATREQALGGHVVQTGDEELDR